MALLRGLPMRLIYVTPSAAVSFALYEQFKRMLRNYQSTMAPQDASPSSEMQEDSIKKVQYEPLIWLTAGAAARLIGTAARTPFDIVKQRMQVQGSLEKPRMSRKKKREEDNFFIYVNFYLFIYVLFLKFIEIHFMHCELFFQRKAGKGCFKGIFVRSCEMCHSQAFISQRMSRSNMSSASSCWTLTPRLGRCPTSTICLQEPWLGPLPPYARSRWTSSSSASKPRRPFLQIRKSTSPSGIVGRRSMLWKASEDSSKDGVLS